MASGTPVLIITDPNSELIKLMEGIAGVKVCTTWDINDLFSSFKNLLDAIELKSHEQMMNDNQDFITRYFSIDKLVEDIIGE